MWEEEDELGGGGGGGGLVYYSASCRNSRYVVVLRYNLQQSMDSASGLEDN